MNLNLVLRPSPIPRRIAIPFLSIACCLSVLLTACKPPAKAGQDSKSRETAVEENRLPVARPPFLVTKAKRQKPELKTTTISTREGDPVEQVAFWVGNKRVGVRETAANGNIREGRMISLMVDDREIFYVTLFGAHKDSGVGYPFESKPGTAPSLSVDREASIIRYAKPYLLPGGETTEFSYTLKSLGDSKVELAWDIGISPEKLATLPADFTGVAPWMISEGAYRNEAISLNGERLEITPMEKLSSTAIRRREGSGPKVEFAPDKPLQGFTVEFPEDNRYFAEERSPGPGRSELVFRSGPTHRETHGRLVIDLGEAAMPDAAAPAAVAGIDFWKRDAMDVPRPSARNLMPNPSFEQGLRYWSWWTGGGVGLSSSDLPKYSVTDGGRFGKKALHIRDGGGKTMQSLPVPVVKDQPYTVSFFAKAAKPNTTFSFGVVGVPRGTKLDWTKALKTKHTVGTEWERKQFPFTPDVSAISLMVESGQDLLIDGIQLEEGNIATNFDSAAVEGMLVTADPDNQLAAGQPMQAAFELSGKPGLKGDVELTVFDYFRKVRSQQKYPFELDAEGVGRIELPYDEKPLGLGVFVVQAKFHAEGEPETRDYYRFSIMEFLENKHATKDLFGTLCRLATISRGEDSARNFQRWGFGSSTYCVTNPEEAELQKKYGIRNYLSVVADCGEIGRNLAKEVMKWTEVTPEREKQVEDAVAEIVAQYPWADHWAFSTESEGKSALLQKENYAEWAKVQLAAARGIKRANPSAVLLADGGTSGFERLRGYRETEGYLAATQGKIKWDVLATHPYGNLDGISAMPRDLDEETTRLIELGKKYGYGPETPIDYTEGFNMADFIVPEWGLRAGTDNYDYFAGSRPTYDFGWRELSQAAWVARTYLIGLKYWPRVRSFNIWVTRPFIDQHLTPLAMCKVPNTLGHLFANPKFITDIRPAAGVRGYAFEDDQGRGLVAIWSNIDRVEKGLEAGPLMQVDFGGDLPEVIDLMGNFHTVSSVDGVTAIPLSPAPLFLRSQKGGVERLIAAVNAASIEGTGSALSITVQPTVSGALELTADNRLNRPVAGEFAVSSGTAIPFHLDPKASANFPFPGAVEPVPGKIFSSIRDLGIRFADGKRETIHFSLAWFFVPRTDRPLPGDPLAPEWNAIPAIPLRNVFINHLPGEEAVRGGYPGDLDAGFQIAWDKENLYVRISAKDDQFLITNPGRWNPRQLYMHDGCAEIYLDTAADGRSQDFQGFGQDDYRYDFSPRAGALEGPAAIYRLREPFHQLAGGIDMPTKEAAAEGVRAQFRRTADGYAYAMIFPQRFIEPLRLEAGWRAGFGLFLHDNDDPKREWPGKGLSLATEPGAHCDARPDLWPTMILKD